MHAEPTERVAVPLPAGSDRGRGHPPSPVIRQAPTHICYCGCRVVGSTICPACASAMVNFFLRAAEAREALEAAVAEVSTSQ